MVVMFVSMPPCPWIHRSRRRLGLADDVRRAGASRSRRVSARLEIRLLGPPAIQRDGAPAPPPRGRKAWAVLAYLALAERPVAARRLAELVFGDADDPLGALRWTLAQLRRALGVPEALRRRPARARAPAGASSTSSR